MLVYGDIRVLRGGLPLLEDSPEQPAGHANGEVGRGLGFGLELGLLPGERIFVWRLQRRVLSFPVSGSGPKQDMRHLYSLFYYQHRSVHMF
jgi:hypothetical protein